MRIFLICLYIFETRSTFIQAKSIIYFSFSEPLKASIVFEQIDWRLSIMLEAVQFLTSFPSSFSLLRQLKATESIFATVQVMNSRIFSVIYPQALLFKKFLILFYFQISLLQFIFLLSFKSTSTIKWKSCSSILSRGSSISSNSLPCFILCLLSRLEIKSFYFQDSS